MLSQLTNWVQLFLVIGSAIVGATIFYVHTLFSDKQKNKEITQLVETVKAQEIKYDLKYDKQENEINTIKVGVAKIETLVGILVNERVTKNGNQP